MESYKNILNRIIKTRPGKNKHINKEEYKTASIGENMYEDKTLYDFNKKAAWMHYVFKYKMFMPILLLLERLLRKHLIREYKTIKWHNKGLQEFDEAYEKALKVWSKYLEVKGAKKNANLYEKGNGSIGVLRLMKNIVLTVCSHDDVYIEFTNMLMNEIRQSKSYNKSGKHLLHTDTFVNGPEYMQYYHIGEYLTSGKIKLKKL